MSKDRYYRHLQILIDCGYIKVERQVEESNWKGRNIYIIVANPEVNPEPETSCHGDTKLGSKKQPSSARTHKVKRSSENLYRKLKIDELVKKYPRECELIEKIYKIVKDLASTNEIKISGTVKTKEELNEIINELTMNTRSSVVYATKQQSKIHNFKAWVQTCILNSAFDPSFEMQNKVRRYNAAYKKQFEKNPSEPFVMIENNCVSVEPEDPFVLEKERELSALCRQKAKLVLSGASVEEINTKIKRLSKQIDDYQQCANA